MAHKKEMKDIEAQVSVLDKQIKASAVKIKKAVKETVDLDNLGLKMLVKYQNFLQYKVDTELN
jgi:hypothetical protein